MPFQKAQKYHYCKVADEPAARLHQDRIAWEEEVYEAMTFALDVTRSDAQAISEAVPDSIEDAWMNDYTPAAAALYIDKASTPGP